MHFPSGMVSRHTEAARLDGPVSVHPVMPGEGVQGRDTEDGGNQGVIGCRASEGILPLNGIIRN